MKSRQAKAAWASILPPTACAPRRAPGGGQRLSGAQQGLRRYAGVVRAFATEQLALDDRDPEAACHQVTGAVLPRRPTAHDDDVVLAHRP